MKLARNTVCVAAVFVFAALARTVPAQNAPRAQFADDFEAGASRQDPLSPWRAGGEPLPVVTNAAKQSLKDFDNDANFVMFPAKDKGNSTLETAIAPAQDSRLVFWVKSELPPIAQVKFSLYVDDKEVFSITGVSEWRQRFVAVSKGTHTVRFSLNKPTTAYGQGIANAVFLDSIALSPNPAPPRELGETFDGNVSIGEARSIWLGTARLVTNDSAAFGNPTRCVELKAPRMTGNASLEILSVAPDADSALSFRFKTEIAGVAGQSFKLFIDNKEAGAWEGVGMLWRTASALVPKGEHSVRFEVASKGGSVQGGANAVYIDDVTLIPDVSASIALEPIGAMQTFVGAPPAEKIVYSASVFRKDNSLKARSPAAGFTFSVDKAGASIDSGGVFTATAPGTYRVTASRDGFSVSSGAITVHDSDFLFKPFFYGGTGKTYAGFTGKGSGEIPPSPSLSIAYPNVRSFDADGFFTLQGKVTKPSAKNYAHIVVSKKTAGGQTLSTTYIVHDSFALRIWLPFGKGEYSVAITMLDSVRLTSPPSGEGDFRGGASYGTDIVTLTAFNTRDEAGIDGDGRWIYPSWQCQSDSFVVMNFLESVKSASGARTPAETARAIHDAIVARLAYDEVSFRNDSRARKNDAVSALINRTAVCEGYSRLAAALFRAAGIPARIAASRAVNHAWNQVYIGGAWKFFDATWDDPSPDRGPYFVDYTYFLLDSLTGGDNRHRGSGTILVGDAEM